jgi:diguanylate cyclase (GGDEF)-like protein
VLVAVASFITALTASSGAALLYLDDVQWLDPSSRRVLQLLTESIETLPLLVVVTGRDDPVSAAAMAQVRAAAGGRFDLALRLRSLPAEMVGDLISAATGGLRVDAATAASLSARSAGNTFTLLQYLDALLDAGLLRPDWGRWRLDLEALPTLVLSGSGVDLILRRLEGLDTDSRYVLRVAAVHGSLFDYRLIADACGLPHSRVLAVADTAAWRNLVERRDGHRYAFLHDRIREALAGEFTAAETKAVHYRLADMLTQSGRTDAASVFALARHCLLGEPERDPARTYRACHAAGQMALAQHAPNEALELLERANRAAAQAGIPFDPAFVILLATAQQRAGRFADAIRTATVGHEQAVEPLVRARFLLLTAEALDTAWEQVKESRIVLQGLAEIGRPFPQKRGALLFSTAGMFVLARLGRTTRLFYGSARGPNREKLRIEASLYSAGAWAYSRQMHVRQAMLCLLRATYPVMRIGPGREEAKLQTGLATMSLALRNQRAGRRHMKRAAALAARVGDPVLTGFVAWVEGFNRHNYGIDQGETLRRVLEVHGRWLEVGQQSDMLFILLWDALQRGSVKLAQQMADQRDGLSRIIGETGSEATARFEIGTAARAARAGLLAWQDRGDEAVMLLGMGTVDERLPRWEQLPIYGGAIAVAYERYDLGEYFDQAVSQFDGLKLPMKVLFPVALGWVLVRALGRIEQVRLARGDQRAARLVLAQDAVELIRRAARIPLLRARAEVARAGLLQVSGQPKAALRHLARCEPAIIAVDAPVLAFEAARTRAHALRDLRIAGEAERQARAALAIAREQEWPHRIRLICREFDIDPGTLSPSELDRVGSVATTNEAIALGRMRQRLAAIEQLGVAASRVVDPDKLATIALDETIRILGAERAFLFLMESPHAHAQLVPWGGRDHEGNDLDVLVEYSASTVERVRRSRAPVVFTGTEGRTAVEAHSVVLHGLRSVMAAPIQLDARLLGVVYLDSRVAKGIFTNDDVGVLTAITNHIAVALETARAAQLEVEVATANRQRDLAERLRAALGDITGALGPEPESVLLRLARIAGDLVDGERVWLVLGTPVESTVLVYAGAGDRPAGAEESTVGGPSDEGSIVELEPRLAELLSSDATVYGYASGSRPKLLDDDVRSWLSVPLRARDEAVGLLVLGSSRGHAFDDGRGDIATSLAGHAMIAYENARLFSQVQQLATIDDLTGIANRRHFFELAERELARARRDGHGLIAMMVDIDHFKNINDEHGHQVGDEVIQIVAGRLARFARSYDLIGRYGGEEFALLMPDGPDPVAIAERVRSAIAASPVPTVAGPLAVTVSVGAVSLSPGDADLSGLLGRADRRLYDAKRAGRNRVVAD